METSNQERLPKICVIGAGVSGMVASKILRERGIPFRCFEKGSDIGGLWRFQNDSGLSAAYESLHINSSRQLMAFSDFPMNHTLPDFPHHSHILSYLEDYADRFRIRDHTTFQTSVTQVEPEESGGFRVTCRNSNGELESNFFDGVIVANGHHWSPKRPELKGDFDGQILHSHDYKTAAPFRDRNVLVVGLGNSGVDIACELSRVASSVCLSTRRGAHIIPKYLLGKPLDRVASRYFWTLCPLWLRQKLFAILLKMTRGRQSRYGLPEPDYKVLQEHPTVSSELLNLLGHGKIRIKPDLRELDNSGVRFVDNSREAIDTIILATGYNIQFPFLDPDLVTTKDNQVSLFKNVIHPTQKGLFFVGLVQPWGPLMPLSEAQSEWIADLIVQKSRIPSSQKMESEIAKEQKRMARRYVKSTRHTIQVDFYPYLKELKKQRKRQRGELAIPAPLSQKTRADHTRSMDSKSEAA